MTQLTVQQIDNISTKKAIDFIGFIEWRSEIRKASKNTYFKNLLNDKALKQVTLPNPKTL